MRSAREYYEKAVEFEKLARGADNPELKKRYADVAECYRLLAKERQRLIATGIIKPESP
jgi:hypothetical protein